MERSMTRLWRTVVAGYRDHKPSKCRRLPSIEPLENRTVPSGPAPSPAAVARPGPMTNDDWSDTDGNTPVVVSVLANDIDFGGKLVASSVRVTTAPSQGAANANADGTITYTASGDFTGTDTFKYTVSDTAGLTSNPATVS